MGLKNQGLGKEAFLRKAAIVAVAIRQIEVPITLLTKHPDAFKSNLRLGESLPDYGGSRRGF